MSKNTLIKWADRVIKGGFFALFITIPLILTPVNYELFEYNKMMLTYGLTVIIAAAWLFKSLAQGKFEIARTPLDIPILLFLGSQILSTVFSIDPHVSWMGYYSRFNGGLWSTISYVVLFYAFVSNYNDYNRYKNYTEKLLKTILAAAAIVALYGAAEHFGIDKNLWVQDVQSRVFSTLGQPNWLAAYLVALIPIAIAMGIKTINDRTSKIGTENRKSKIDRLNLSSIFERLPLFSVIYFLLSFLFFLVLLFTRSRSGLLGFIVADMVFWGVIILIFVLIVLRFNLFSKKVKPFEAKFWIFFPIIILHLIFALIVFFNGTYIDQVDKYFSLSGWQKRFSKPATYNPQPTTNAANHSGTLLEYGGTESSTIRKYVWQGALNAWNSSTKTRLIGTGTETFAFAFFQYKPKAHNLTSEWDFLYNKAHNEYLNYLATTGAIGLGTYLLLIAAFMAWFVKSQITNQNVRHSTENFLQIALFSGWISILVTNFFGFSVVIIQLFFFLFPAFCFAGTQTSGNKQFRQLELKLSAKILKACYFTILLALPALLALLFTHWYADTLFTLGTRYDRSGAFDKAQIVLSTAVNLNTNEPVYHDELSSALAGLAVALAAEKQSSQAASLMKQSVLESDKALYISPKNVNFWKTRTKIFYSFSTYLPEMNRAAVEALLQAKKLSPNDPKIYYNLAILLGRENKNNESIDYLKQTIDLKPNYRDAYYALYIFYNEEKKPDLAKQILHDYLAKVDSQDKDFLQRVGQL